MAKTDKTSDAPAKIKVNFTTEELIKKRFHELARHVRRTEAALAPHLEAWNNAKSDEEREVIRAARIAIEADADGTGKTFHDLQMELSATVRTLGVRYGRPVNMGAPPPELHPDNDGNELA